MVSRYIGELEGKVEKRASKPVTFSMRMSAREHAKLVWLANNLDVPKTPFAEELLKAALDEAIERYAGWAAPEDPEGFIAQALEGRVPGTTRQSRSVARRVGGRKRCSQARYSPSPLAWCSSVRGA